MKQLPQRRRCRLRRDRARIMHRPITKVLDDPRLCDERIADQSAEGTFMDQRRQCIVIRACAARASCAYIHLIAVSSASRE